jgi:hypothetical protein
MLDAASIRAWYLRHIHRWSFRKNIVRGCGLAEIILLNGCILRITVISLRRTETLSRPKRLFAGGAQYHQLAAGSGSLEARQLFCILA